MEPFYQAGRGDSHHAHMPTPGREDQRRRQLLVIHRLNSLGHEVGFDFLPLPIELSNRSANRCASAGESVVRSCTPSIAWSSRPAALSLGASLKAIVSGEIPHHPGHLLQGSDPAALRARSARAPAARSPILILQRHHVGDRRQRH